MITKKQFSLVAHLPKGFLLIALLFLCGTSPILAHLNFSRTVVVNTTMIQDDCSGVPQWSASEVYTNGMQAIFEGIRYRAKWWTRGEDPSKSGQWDVWVSLGACDDGNPDPNPDPDPDPNPDPDPDPDPDPVANVPPTVSISAPNNNSVIDEGNSVELTANASDSDGSISSVAFFNNGTLVAEDNTAPYATNLSTLSVGTYVITADATDNEGAVTKSSAVTFTVEANNPPPPPTNTGDLPARILNGYWHNFDNGSGITRLRDVSANWDIINISFAVPTVSVTDGNIGFELDDVYNTIGYSEADFKADIRLLQSRGKKIIISIGGAEGQVRLNTANAATKFTKSMTAIIREYGFNGMDIDFEGNSLSFDRGDTDFRNPTTPVLVNTINAIRGVTNNFGDDFILTMAPETFFVQLGYQFYGGINSFVDSRAGAYLPVIHALRDKLTFLQVQYYNSGSITALDNVAYSMGDADFYVSLVDMLLRGFPVNGDASKFFPALRQDQVLLGVPATTNAGGGYTSPETVISGLDYLIRGNSFGGRYTLGQTYPNLRGVMSWSTNWDEFGNLNFSNKIRAYLDGLPQTSATTAVRAAILPETDTKLYPNPATGNEVTVRLTTKTDTREFAFQLFNVSGVSVLQNDNANLVKGVNLVTVNLGGLPSGLYFYTITTAEETVRGELLID